MLEKQERKERRAEEQERRKSRNSRGCDKLIYIYETHITPRMNEIYDERREELIKYSLEFVKTLEVVLQYSSAPVEETNLPGFSQELRKKYFENEEEMEAKKEEITPRPPFTVILEMGQLILQGTNENIEDWFQMVYRKSRLDDNKENPLSARVFCRVYRQARSELKYWGANVGAFRFNNDKLVKHYIKNLKRVYFHRHVTDAIDLAQRDEPIQEDGFSKLNTVLQEVCCSAFKYGDQEKVFENLQYVGPCQRCKEMYHSVIFDPDGPYGDILYPWGRCAENYAFSKLLNA